MPILSQAQIAMYARAAGMPNPDVMAAIAMAESSGNTNAHNPVGLDNSYGLWQINMLGNMGPVRRRQLGISNNSQLFDPAVNAKAAAMILRQQGLSAWSTYTNGAYKKYLGKSSSGGASQVLDWDDPLRVIPPYQLWKFFGEGEPLPDFGDDVPDWVPGDTALEGLEAVNDMAARAGAWMSNPKNWVNVLYVTSGGILIILAVSSTVRRQAIGQLTGIGKKMM